MVAMSWRPLLATREARRFGDAPPLACFRAEAHAPLIRLCTIRVHAFLKKVNYKFIALESITFLKYIQAG